MDTRPAGWLQTLEVRTVNQSTGAAVVLGTVTATAAPGPLAQFGFRDHLFTMWARSSVTLDTLRRLIGVEVADSFGNPLPLSRVTFRTDTALTLSHDTLTAGGRWGTVFGSAGSFKDSARVAVIDDWRGRHMTFTCRYVGAASGDSAVIALTSDSARYFPMSNNVPAPLPTTSFPVTWVAYMSGTAIESNPSGSNSVVLTGQVFLNVTASPDSVALYSSPLVTGNPTTPRAVGLPATFSFANACAPPLHYWIGVDLGPFRAGGPAIVTVR